MNVSMILYAVDWCNYQYPLENIRDNSTAQNYISCLENKNLKNTPQACLARNYGY